MVCFRDKRAKNLKKEAKAFLSQAKRLSIEKVLLNGDIALAKRLGFYGVHLPSTHIRKIRIAKRAKLFVIVSTHDMEEMKRAQREGADMITYSPIFSSPNKGAPKGLKNLRKMVRLANLPLIALGGITKRGQIHDVRIKGARGFAAIRYFV